MPVRPLTPALAEKARRELNEDDPKLLEEGIRHLKQWALEQPHLKARTDDQWLAAFLRGCKHRLEQSKLKLDKYFYMRCAAPCLYSVKYVDPKLMHILNLGVILVLRKTIKPEDPRVIIHRIGRYDTNEYTLLDILSVLNLQEQICFMEDDNLVVSGTVNVIDLAGTNVWHYTQTSVKQIKYLITAHQEAKPIRIRSLHFFNTPPYFETFFSVVRGFLNEKTKNKVMIHGKNIESLHEHVSKDVLPEVYGGTGESIQECIDYWKKKMSDYRTFFEDDLKCGSDESKRNKIPRLTTIDKSFGDLEID